jgi:GntR family transcriptional regulator, transcriptional repressor for pyruvate dehydrogenase complex
MIVEGRLQPHQRLPSEKDLAAALGVSRPTLREAVRGLMALRIVEARHGDGTYITSLAPELLAEPIDFLLRLDKDNLAILGETREVLESNIAQLAAARAKAEDIQALERTVAQYAQAIDDIDRCIELDQAFHAQVARAARSPILASLISTVSMLARKSRQSTARSETIRRQSDVDHRRILEAIQQGDGEAAAQAMRSHLHNVLAASTYHDHGDEHDR